MPRSRRVPNAAVIGWARTADASFRAVSTPKLRQRLARARRTGAAVAACPRAAGRRPRSHVASESDRKRACRAKAAAERCALSVIEHLVRLRAIVKTSVHVASDHRRMMRLAHALRRSKATDAAMVVALLYDRAFRRPSLSLALATSFHAATFHHGCDTTAAWQAVRVVRRRRDARKQNHQYWAGPCAFHAAQMIATWTKHMVVPVAVAIASHGGRLDAKKVVPLLETLPHMTAYGSFHFLRSLRWALDAPLHGEAEWAGRMSSGVAAMCAIAPLPRVLQCIRTCRPRGQRSAGLGDAALVLCEASKACAALGVLPKDHKSWTPDAMRRAFNEPAARMLLRCLQRMTPLADVELHAVTNARAREEQDLDAALPVTAEPWDAEPHFCKGSEMLTPCLRQQLFKLGWRRDLRALPDELWE